MSNPYDEALAARIKNQNGNNPESYIDAHRDLDLAFAREHFPAWRPKTYAPPASPAKAEPLRKAQAAPGKTDTPAAPEKTPPRKEAPAADKLQGHRRAAAQRLLKAIDNIRASSKRGDGEALIRSKTSKDPKDEDRGLRFLNNLQELASAHFNFTDAMK